MLGVVENMSYFVGDDGKRYDLFGSGAGRKLAAEAGVALLAELPIDPRVAACGDRQPVRPQHPDAPVAKAYMALAATVMKETAARPGPGPLPEVQL